MLSIGVIVGSTRPGGDHIETHEPRCGRRSGKPNTSKSRNNELHIV
jgi:hypothetical protein